MMVPGLGRGVSPLGAVLVAILVWGSTGTGVPSQCEQFPHEVLPETSTSPAEASLDDVRVRAFLEAFGPFIDGAVETDNDVVFTLSGQHIHFRDGRMLREDRLGEAGSYDSVFYIYPLEPLSRPPPITPVPHYSVDVFEAAFGATESEIRRHCGSVSFLGHRMFLNALLHEPLKRVEREITEAAAADAAVAQWIDDLEITYSFLFRGIADSQTRSLHSFGLAVDLVPSSYEGRHVYWRWSRALDRENWHRIPLEQRWSPPRPVIEAFERHGFVWGGKWAYFDSMHFEYRPEILAYNRNVRKLADRPEVNPPHVAIEE